MAASKPTVQDFNNGAGLITRLDVTVRETPYSLRVRKASRVNSRVHWFAVFRHTTTS